MATLNLNTEKIDKLYIGSQLVVESGGASSGSWNVGDVIPRSKINEIYSFSNEFKRAWQKQNNAVPSVVLVDSEGNIIFGENKENPNVVKLNNLGDEVWRFSGHSKMIKSVVVDKEDNIYSASDDGTLRKISKDGQEVWNFTGHTREISRAVIDTDDNIYTGSFDKTLRKISKDGQEIWKFTGHTDIVAKLAIDSENNIYSFSNDNYIRKISKDGQEIWKRNPGGYVLGINVDGDGNLIIVNANNMVVKFMQDGRRAWTNSTRDMMNSICIDSNNDIYVGGSNGNIIKYSKDGTKLSTFLNGSQNITSMHIDHEGNLYTGDYGYQVKKISPKSKKLLGYKILRNKEEA